MFKPPPPREANVCRHPSQAVKRVNNVWLLSLFSIPHIYLSCFACRAIRRLLSGKIRRSIVPAHFTRPCCIAGQREAGTAPPYRLARWVPPLPQPRTRPTLPFDGPLQTSTLVQAMRLAIQVVPEVEVALNTLYHLYHPDTAV